jgi:hypothetical protein
MLFLDFDKKLPDGFFLGFLSDTHGVKILFELSDQSRFENDALFVAYHSRSVKMKILIYPLLFVSLLGPVSCKKDSAASPQAPASVQITYTVTGTVGATTSIGYNIPDGSYTTVTTTLPYTSPTYTFPSGGWTFIQAVYVGLSASITANITKDGALWKTATAAGGSVNVSSSVP